MPQIDKGFFRVRGITLPDPHDDTLQRVLKSGQAAPRTLRGCNEKTLSKIIAAAVAYVGLTTPQDADEKKEITELLPAVWSYLEKQRDGDATQIYDAKHIPNDETIIQDRYIEEQARILEEKATDDLLRSLEDQVDDDDAETGGMIAFLANNLSEGIYAWPENISFKDMGKGTLEIYVPGRKIPFHVKGEAKNLAKELLRARAENAKIFDQDRVSFEITTGNRATGEKE